MKATSNQKARPWTSPECSMWNLNGISILEGKGQWFAGEAKMSWWGEGEGVARYRGRDPLTTCPKTTEGQQEPVVALTFSMSQDGGGEVGMGCGCWYLCKSPSLASKKFTVYLTDLAIRIRMSNVSWERPQA